MSNTPPAGYVRVPAEMTPEQARRSLAGHALADRLRNTAPEQYARLVEIRQATWRQLVAVMMEDATRRRLVAEIIKPTPPEDEA